MQYCTRPSAVSDRPAGPSSPGTPGWFTGGDPVAGIQATVPGYEWFNTVQGELGAVVAAGGLTLDPDDDGQLQASIARQVQAQAGNIGLDTGPANALAVTITPPPILAPGLTLRVRAAHGNTGPVSLSINGATAAPVVDTDGAALSAGDIGAGEVITLVWSGAAWQMASAPAPAHRRRQSLGVNGYARMPGGLVLQWGRITDLAGVEGGIGTQAALTITFPIPFTVACFYVGASGLDLSDYREGSEWSVGARALTLTGAELTLSRASGVPVSGELRAVMWMAIGA